MCRMSRMYSKPIRNLYLWVLGAQPSKQSRRKWRGREVFHAGRYLQCIHLASLRALWLNSQAGRASQGDDTQFTQVGIRNVSAMYISGALGQSRQDLLGQRSSGGRRKEGRRVGKWSQPMTNPWGKDPKGGGRGQAHQRPAWASTMHPQCVLSDALSILLLDFLNQTPRPVIRTICHDSHLSDLCKMPSDKDVLEGGREGHSGWDEKREPTKRQRKGWRGRPELSQVVKSTSAIPEGRRNMCFL